MNQIPFNDNSLGAYSYGGSTGILPVIGTLGSNAEIFQFRFVSGTARLCAIRRIRISASVTTTMFAAGVPIQVDLIKSTSWSVAGTGGTAVAPAALLKRKTDMQSTVIASGDIRIATTAALGAGTKTLETLSQASIVAGGPITASLNGTIFPAGTVLWQADSADGDYPIILAHQEGLSIVVVNAPATGTWQATVSIDWQEFINQ